MARAIPKWVYAPAGPVVVKIVKKLVNPDTEQECFGLWEPGIRVISIDASLSPIVAQQFLYHEQFHAWLDDLGVELNDTMIERLCDGYAAGRMGELQWKTNEKS